MGQYCEICSKRYEPGGCDHDEEAHRQHEAGQLEESLSRIEAKIDSNTRKLDQALVAIGQILREVAQIIT